MTAVSYLDYLDAFACSVGEQKNVDVIFKILEKKLKSLGFDKYSYWRLWPVEGPRTPFFKTNYKLEWLEHYLREDYNSHDLVGRHAARTSMPFSWAQITESKRLSDFQKQIFDESIDAGIGSGASIPLHGPGAGKAALSVANDMPVVEFQKLFLSYRHELLILAMIVHERIVDLVVNDFHPLINLTNREIEVLTWSCKGKTEWEISSILSISKDTVNDHISNSRVKLGATNKTHAVVLALANGLITP